LFCFALFSCDTFFPSQTEPRRKIQQEEDENDDDEEEEENEDDDDDDGTWVDLLVLQHEK